MATLRKPLRYKSACESFDASEAAFGKCRTCGFSLADHLAGHGDAEDAENDVVEEEVPPPPEEEPPKPQACHNFTFKKDGHGECECGFPMEEHRSEEKPASFRRSVRNFARRISRKFAKSVEVPREPCEHFAIDLNSEQYGLCFCGFNKLEHEQAAAKRAEEEELRRAFEASQPEPPAAPKRLEACDHFDLDLASEGGYGVCVCGFPREQHQDFKVKPSEWDDVKGRLTKPKPFE